MVQRYEQTRKLQWYKRGVAYLAADQTMATTGTVIRKGDLVPLLTVEYESVYTLTVTDAKAATLVLPYDAKIPTGMRLIFPVLGV